MMNEPENPSLHISGTITERDHKAAIRALGLRPFVKYTIIYVAVIVLITFGTSLHYSYSVIKDGYITFGECLRKIWVPLLFRSSAWYIAAGFLALYALIIFLIKPILAGKRMRELYPEGFPVTYNFYGEQLVMQATTQMSDETIRIRYADVQRRIRENKYIIVLSTNQRNRFSVYKTIMTPEETITVMELLKARCPQHKLLHR